MRTESEYTINSYIWALARIAALIPLLLDGLGPMHNRKLLADIYAHILSSGSKFRAMVQTIPPFLLRGPAQGEELLSWLPLARVSLTTSAVGNIIMIHQPVLFRSFYIPEFQRTRTTCVSAALTILQQHENITEREGSISLWTNSAFCVTAVMVIGVDLLYQVNHTDEKARRLRLELIRAAARLRIRKCDIIAGRGAALIDAILGMEEEIVVDLMRADLRDVSAERMQRNIINDMIANNEIIAKFLAVDPGDPSGMLIASPPGDFDPSLQTVCDSGTPREGADDIQAWFRSVLLFNYETS